MCPFWMFPHFGQPHMAASLVLLFVLFRLWRLMRCWKTIFVRNPNVRQMMIQRKSNLGLIFSYSNNSVCTSKRLTAAKHSLPYNAISYIIPLLLLLFVSISIMMLGTVRRMPCARSWFYSFTLFNATHFQSAFYQISHCMNKKISRSFIPNVWCVIELKRSNVSVYYLDH